MRPNSRNRILAAARESFYRNGYLATSVDTLLRQSGVSKSNFYYHFPGKEDLGLAVLLDRWTEFEQTLECTLRRDGADPTERLEAFLGRVAESQTLASGHGGCPFGNLVAEMAEQSERFRCVLSDLFGRLASEIALVVYEGQVSGQFRQDVDAQSLSRLLVHATQGMHTMAKCGGSDDGPSETARLLLDLLTLPQAHQASTARAA